MIADITNVFEIDGPITFVKTFGDRLRHARTLRKLTQKELARACGLSQGAIGNYEANSRRSAKDVFRLADALDVEPAWLAMGTGPMKRAPAQGVAEGRDPQVSQAWPFPEIDPQRIWALSAKQRDVLANAISGLLEAMEEDG